MGAEAHSFLSRRQTAVESIAVRYKEKSGSRQDEAVDTAITIHPSSSSSSSLLDHIHSRAPPRHPHIGCFLETVNSDLSHPTRLQVPLPSTGKLAAPRCILRAFALNSRRYPSPSYPSRTFISAFVTLAPSRPTSRLNLLSGHLDSKPFLELNTPFSTERSALQEDEQGNLAKEPSPPEPDKVPEPQPDTPKPHPMSTQPPHPALLIPGPIEFDDAVLQSMSHYRYAPLSNKLDVTGY